MDNQNVTFTLKTFYSAAKLLCFIKNNVKKETQAMKKLIATQAHLTRMENFHNASDTSWDTERRLVRLGPSTQVPIKHLNSQH